MEAAFSIVVLIAVAVAVSAYAQRRTLTPPLVLIVVGFALSYMPFLHHIELTPDLVLIGLLPPLLYGAAIRTPLMDFRENFRPIALLSVGLVLFTAAGVAAVAHQLLEVSWPVAFALGAVVAPPDAVAATAVARRVGMPRRVVTILEGESLVNDATAIVTLRSSIAAIAGAVTFWEIGGAFVVSAVGGAVVGLAVAQAVTWIRQFTEDEVTDVSVSLLTPWMAYLLAEQLHVPGIHGEPSGVLAVVVAGLILGHRSPVIQSGASRLFERTNWATILFVLENIVFLLIGLQLRSILDGVGAHPLPSWHIVWISLTVLASVILLRMVGVFWAVYLPRKCLPGAREREPPPSCRTTMLVSWAGMRGVITLAAVFLLPEDTPSREILVFIAFVVTVGTLLVQGLTLPCLVRRLGVRGVDRSAEALREATVMQQVSDAGLAYLEEHIAGTVDDAVLVRLRTASADRVDAAWERLDDAIETPSEQFARARAAMLRAERSEVLKLRGESGVDQIVLARVLARLDAEESILERYTEIDEDPTAS